MDVKSRVRSSEQILESSIQDFLNSHDLHRNSLGNPGISEKFHHVAHNWNHDMNTKPGDVLNINQERNEVRNMDSSERVDFSDEPSETYNILSQRHGDIDPSLSLQNPSKNNPLYNTEYNIQIPNHIQRPYHRTSANQKSKRFFPDVNKDISVNAGTTIGTSLSGRGVTPYNIERSGFGADILQDNFVTKEHPSHKTYENEDRTFGVRKDTKSYKAHHKLSINIDHKMPSNDTRNQIQALESEERNIYNNSGYENSMNSIQFRHSHHFRQIEGRSFRSLIEAIEESEAENIGVHWPVKREAVVEGDLVLGGLMMVHEREDMYTCGPIMPQGGIQALETMLYTLDVLNKDQMIPNVTIGAHILDDCDKDTYGLEMAVDFIKGRTRWTGIFLFNSFRSYV
jgi:hypothetical protein